MITKSKNKQVVASLDKLSSTLYELLKDNSYQDISITDICNKSNVTRITFYRNCDTKEDIVEYLCNKINNGLLDAVSFKEEDPKIIILGIFKYFKGQEEFLRIMNNNHLMPIFCKSLINTSLVSFSFLFMEINNEERTSLNYYNSFMVGGISNVIDSWVKNDFDLSVDQLVDICCNNYQIKQ